MPEANNTDIEFYTFIGIAIIILLILLVCKTCIFIKEFTLEIRYINNEIRRTTGNERRYWIYMRRRLWLSLIPFVKY